MCQYSITFHLGADHSKNTYTILIPLPHYSSSLRRCPSVEITDFCFHTSKFRFILAQWFRTTYMYVGKVFSLYGYYLIWWVFNLFTLIWIYLIQWWFVPRFIFIGPVVLKIFYFEIRQKYFICSIAIISPCKGTYVAFVWKKKPTTWIPLSQEGTACRVWLKLVQWFWGRN